MGKQISHRRRSTRSPRRGARSRKKPNTLGLRLLLLVALVLLAGLLLVRIPPTFLIAGGIGVLVLFLLIVGLWWYLRVRPTPAERQIWLEQQGEYVPEEPVAQISAARALELQDLAYLGHDEFEYFTGALLETLGVLFEWERVGGAGDRGVDLRGKNQFGRLFIVQCKHYFGRAIAPNMTRELRGTWQGQGADTAWFVTTSTFTRQAQEEVSGLAHRGIVALVDGPKLMEYIYEHWDALPANWQQRLVECMQEHDQRQRES